MPRAERGDERKCRSRAADRAGATQRKVASHLHRRWRLPLSLRRFRGAGDVLRLRAFLALGDIELHLVALL